MQAILFSALSDLLIDLSAGWFGAAIILPLYTKKSKIKLRALIFNVLSGILALLTSIALRSSL